MSAKTDSVRTGISFGVALAIAISWDQFHSVLLALLHGCLSWLYVVWFLMTRPG